MSPVPPLPSGRPIPRYATRNGRVHLLAIDERPVWSDPTIGAIFADMRHAMRKTRGELARRLETTEAVIDHLEAGRLRSLPAWPEAQRIVSAYGVRLGIDVHPLLQRIRQQTMASDADVPTEHLPRPSYPVLRAGPALPPPPAYQAIGGPAGPREILAPPPDAGRRAGRSSKQRRRFLRWAMLIFGGLAAAAVLHNPAAPLAMARDRLAALDRPEAMPIVRQLDDLIARLNDRRLRWIEVDDPQTRKADKLPAGPI